jgi:class 3 adenylate cyclase
MSKRGWDTTWASLAAEETDHDGDQGCSYQRRRIVSNRRRRGCADGLSRRELIEPTIADHYGRMVKTTGDGFIAIFDSPVEAVRCAIVIQQNMVARGALVPRQHRIVYRIGVNLGDVIVEPTDVHGEGVNVAARLEGIATP